MSQTADAWKFRHPTEVPRPGHESENVIAKSIASGQGSGAGPNQPAIAVEAQLRQRTVELDTALREAERVNESLRESDAKFRSLAQNSLLGISIIVDGKYTYVNPAYVETFGYGADEMLLLDPLARIAPSDRAFAAEKLRQALASEIERAEFALCVQRKDGTLLNIELSGSAMLVNGKRSLILLTKDITARTTAERRLRESEETLRTVAASAHDAILMINNDGQITFWNDAAENIFGHTGSEAIGQDLHALLAAPPYRQTYREPFAHFRKTGKGEAIGALRELSAVRKDGTEFPIELSLSAVKLEEKWNAVGIVRDITERKRLERTRREHSERMIAQATALDAITRAEKEFNNDIDALFRAVTEQVALGTGVARASIWLFNAEETQLHCSDVYESDAAHHSDGALLVENHFASEFRALKSAGYVAADDALTDTRTSGYAETYLKPFAISALLDSMIEVSGKYLGMLRLEHVRRSHHWEDDEIAFASQVTARIGLLLLARSRLQAERAQHESERRLSGILDNVELISIMLDREARLTYCNDYLLRISGWRREEIIGRRWEDVFRSPRTVSQMHTLLADLLADRPSAWHHESEIVMRNGESRTIFWNNTALRSPDGDIIGAASVGQDITERDAAEKKLSLFRALIDHSNDAIEVVDVQTRRLIDVNVRACKDLGYSREELLSLSVSDIDAVDDPVRISDIGKRLEEVGFVVIESLHRRKDRSVFPVELSLRMIVLDKPYVVSVARDITERKLAEQKLQALQQLLLEQAIHDPLTGLYNRRYLEEVLARELIIAERKGHSVSAIMGDLDHFKLVNDHYGHRAGDQVLRTFGKLLKSCSRGSDVDCRYGGEEFLLLLPDIKEQPARERAETLRVALASTPVQFEGSVIPVTGSFGVACFPEHARTGDSLIAAADKALYAAKEAGRNRVMSYSDLGAGA
ncbi:MAG: PAS domain S-box protein [Rhodanobacteraceae bacterium]